MIIFDILNSPVSPTPDAIILAGVLQAGKHRIKGNVKDAVRTGVKKLKDKFGKKPKPKEGSAGDEGVNKPFSDKINQEKKAMILVYFVAPRRLRKLVPLVPK